MKRRQFINNAALLGLAPFFSSINCFSAQAFKKAVESKRSVIVIFQRGAVDGLSMLSPYGDQNFTKEIRPNLNIQADQLLKLDSFFGLHPSLTGFKSLWDKGLLAPVHQVGSISSSRSHFDSQDYLESGTPDIKSTETGFITRACQGLKNEKDFTLTSLAVQKNLPRIISGNSKSLSFSNLNGFSIKGFKNTATAGQLTGFESYFDTALDEVLTGQSQNSVSLLKDFEKAQKTEIKSTFPKGPLSQQLKDIAKIIKSGMHIPFYVTEMGGWDTHNNQGNDKGLLANKLKEFSDSITAFVEELGPAIEDVTIITVTEFGRTVRENGSRGTDHGHGSCYFVINGELKSKTIHANWKDLKKSNLYQERDLPVTTDFRDVFAQVLRKQFAITDTKEIFPNYKLLNPSLRIF